MPVAPRTPVGLEPVYEAFGSRLRTARKAQGLTLQALGRRIGRSDQFVSEVEAGRRRVKLHAAVALAAAVGLSLAELTAPSAARERLEALADE